MITYDSIKRLKANAHRVRARLLATTTVEKATVNTIIDNADLRALPVNTD